MNFDDFINKWKGRGIDFDGYYGDQCMDLMHQYCVEVLGLTDGRILAAPSAAQVYSNFYNVFGNEKFDIIANSPTAVPQKGDIMFWGTKLGQHGHVAIFVEGDVNRFKSFDQNYPVGAKCQLVEHTYTHVVGWLRFKQAEKMVTIPQAELDEIRRARDEHYNELQESKKTVENLNQTINDKNRKIDDLTSEISSLNTRVLKLEEDNDILSVQTAVIPELTEQLKQSEHDRELVLAAQESMNKQLGQLRNTSYKTAKSSVLASELVTRLLDRFVKRG